MRRKDSTTAPVSEKVLLTVKEAAALISVSPSQAYNLVAKGVIPSVRVGPRSTRIPRIALDNWAASVALRPAAGD